MSNWPNSKIKFKLKTYKKLNYLRAHIPNVHAIGNTNNYFHLIFMPNNDVIETSVWHFSIENHYE